MKENLTTRGLDEQHVEHLDLKHHHSTPVSSSSWKGLSPLHLGPALVKECLARVVVLPKTLSYLANQFPEACEQPFSPTDLPAVSVPPAAEQRQGNRPLPPLSLYESWWARTSPPRPCSPSSVSSDIQILRMCSHCPGPAHGVDGCLQICMAICSMSGAWCNLRCAIELTAVSVDMIGRNGEGLLLSSYWLQTLPTKFIAQRMV